MGIVEINDLKQKLKDKDDHILRLQQAVYLGSKMIECFLTDANEEGTLEHYRESLKGIPEKMESAIAWDEQVSLAPYTDIIEGCGGWNSVLMEWDSECDCHTPWQTGVNNTVGDGTREGAIMEAKQWARITSDLVYKGPVT